MGSTRINKTPIALALLVIVLLASLWHGRENLPDKPVEYIKGKIRKRPSFYEIAKSHGTDKVTMHPYQDMYEHRLAPIRDKHVKMLEIGLGCSMGYGPGASYYTWLEYFRSVDLYYIEFDAECAKKWAGKTEGATIFAGDQADPVFLNHFIKEAGSNFDIIVDDGGHSMVQQKTSLSVLWPHIKGGGIYFIEDLGTSYMGHMEGGRDRADTMMADLKNMVDDIHRMTQERNPVSKDLINFKMTRELVALTKRSDYVCPNV
ncbi:hypothetical protein B0J14DRAFT_304579 [Halenospora varia]|nr:hypothetical protein B0J14DRAFT_304579 [Halenospora varia]